MALTATDQLHLRRLADAVERDAWRKRAANPLSAGERRGTFATAYHTRLSNRSLSARMSAAHYAPSLRLRRLSEALTVLAADASTPRYMLADCGQQGAARYVVERRMLDAAPAWQPFAAMVLAAVRNMRRLRWQSGAQPTPPTTAAPAHAANYATCERCGEHTYAAGYGCYNAACA